MLLQLGQQFQAKTALTCSVVVASWPKEDATHQHQAAVQSSPLQALQRVPQKRVVPRWFIPLPGCLQ